MSPTARSMAFLRASGFTVGVVERWIPGANVRRDFLNCIDLVAVHPGRRLILAAQVTTASNIASRLNKARARPELRDWLQAGGLFEVHGWNKRGGRWQVRRVEVLAGDLDVREIVRPRRRGRQVVQGGLFD